MSIETDPELGGAGGSFTAAIIVIEELAKVDASVSVLCDVHNTLVNTVLRKYATKDLQEKYLPQLSSDKLGSFALSEPASGSDAFAMKTSCKKTDDGKHYIINGSKMWITNSAEAEFFIVFAQGDPSKGYKGISAFAVEKNMGVEIAKKEKKLGIRASSTCTVNFDEVKVPVENLIGEEGKGYKIAIEILNEGRVGIGAQMVGIAQGAFDKSVRYAAERKQFGQSVASFQGMQFQMAQAATEIEAARLMVYNAARLKEEGRPFTKQAAMAKLYASQVAASVGSSAIDWAGGLGFTRETGIEKYWRDSKIGGELVADSVQSVTGRTTDPFDLPFVLPLQPSTRERATSSCRPSRSSLSRRWVCKVSYGHIGCCISVFPSSPEFNHYRDHSERMSAASSSPTCEAWHHKCSKGCLDASPTSDTPFPVAAHLDS
jgi:hypothetical protein